MPAYLNEKGGARTVFPWITKCVFIAPETKYLLKPLSRDQFATQTGFKWRGGAKPLRVILNLLAYYHSLSTSVSYVPQQTSQSMAGGWRSRVTDTTLSVSS